MRLVVAGLAAIFLASVGDCACAGQLPLASVRYLNPYQNPTNGRWNMLVRIQSGADYSAALNTDVPLNAYVTTPSNNWQDIYIPASAFKAVQPAADLTHIWDMALSIANAYAGA